MPRKTSKRKPVRYIKTEDGSFVPEKYYRVNKPPRSVPRYRREGKKYIRISAKGRQTTRRKRK